MDVQMCNMGEVIMVGLMGLSILSAIFTMTILGYSIYREIVRK